VHDATGFGDLLLELQQVGVEVREDVVLQCGAGRAELGPVGQLGDDGVALAADGPGRATQVVA
jgi:hypothetical protein